MHTYHVMKPQLFQDHHRSRACDGPIGGEREHTHHTRVRQTDSGLKRLILDLVCVCVCLCTEGFERPKLEERVNYTLNGVVDYYVILLISLLFCMENLNANQYCRNRSSS